MSGAVIAAPVWPSFRVAAPPFGAAEGDREAWRCIARRTLLPVALVALALPWLPRAQAPRPPAVLPPLQARLLVEPAPLPPPAGRPPVPKAEATAPVARSAVVVPEARQPRPQLRPGERDEQQRVATGMGLLALKQQLAQIHGAPTAVQLVAPAQPGRGVGQGQGPGVGAGSEPGLPLRALIATQGSGDSGGIGNAPFSRDSGGGGLPGRATTLVAGVAGGSGGGGPGGGGYGRPGARGAEAGASAGGPGAKGGGAAAKARRSIEDIKLVFDRHKGAIHALYNRALRDEPALQGKVVLELRIAPGGEVVDCRIVASELHAAELERKLVARVRQFDFGAKDVEPMVVTWPVDFLPS